MTTRAASTLIRRSPTRSAVRIARWSVALIIFGMTTNIATAIALTLWSPPLQPRDNQEGNFPRSVGWGSPSRYEVLRAVGYRFDFYRWTGITSRGEAQREKHRNSRMLINSAGFDEMVMVSRQVSGWPFLSMSTACVEREIRNDLSMPVHLRGPKWIQRGASIPAFLSTADNKDRRIGLMPMWQGFMLNTAIFAAIPATILAFRAGRTHWRTSRSCCSRCGYPVAGLARCPECGVSSAKLGSSPPASATPEPTT